MSARVQGKIAIVTGGAQGIGKSIAETLARNGATVVVSDVKAEQGLATAAALGGTFFPCDVSDFDQVHALVDACAARYGRLDIMVNNAGINSNRPEDRVTADRYPIETWHKIINVDLHGTFHGCQAAAQQMVEQRSGSIVNIASVAGVVAAEITWIGQIVNWGVGSSIGSIMKNMALRMMGSQPAVTVSPQADSKTTVVTESPKPEEGITK